jgi:lycopene beta-cyclase
MPAYDFVIAGGGLAGLSLACHLVRSPLCGASILVIDRAPPGSDRLWSYWTDRATLFDPIVQQAWSQIHIANRAYARTLDLPGCRFELVRGADLQRFARHELSLHANVTFWHGAVEGIHAGARGARVAANGQTVAAGWVFDSTHWPHAWARPGQQLGMHFQGWTIQTQRPAFGPDAVTFLDTRTPQQHALRFFYVLPYSDRQALVEYVVYARERPRREEALAALHSYLPAAWGVSDYDVVGEEAGWLPMLAARAPRRLGPHHLAIGARAGLIKPTTGFAFRRIQADSAAIVRSLLRTGKPWSLPPVSERHRLYDALLLDVLERRGQAIEAIFAALFARNRLDRVLRFLDETSTPAEDLELIATLPTQPFLEALPRMAARRLAGWPRIANS